MRLTSHSKDCQVQHWKHHKPDCNWIKEHYDECKEAMNNDLPDATVNDTKEGPCAICLEETITNPVILPCAHAFCFSCVGKYQYSSNSKEKLCPYCRGEIPDVGVKAVKRAGLYGDRAIVSSKGSEKQKKYAKLAIAEFESLMELVDPEDKEGYTSLLHMKSRMMAMTDQPDKTIKITGEVLSLNEEHPGVYNVDKLAEAKHWQAKAYIALGKWKEAEKI